MLFIYVILNSVSTAAFWFVSVVGFKFYVRDIVVYIVLHASKYIIEVTDLGRIMGCISPFICGIFPIHAFWVSESNYITPFQISPLPCFTFSLEASIEVK